MCRGGAYVPARLNVIAVPFFVINVPKQGIFI